jgi:hypothetical protein
MPDAEIVGYDESPLTTADVEREFAATRRPRPRLTSRISSWSPIARDDRVDP